MTDGIAGFIRSYFNRDFFRYLVAGGSAALVNWTVFFVCFHLLGLSYVLSGVAAFVIAWTVNTAITVRYVFHKRDRFAFQTSLLLMLIVSLIGALLDVSLLGVFYKTVGVPAMLSKVIASGLVLGWNYTARKYFIYSPSADGPAEAPGDAVFDSFFARLRGSFIGRHAAWLLLLAVFAGGLLGVQLYLDAQTPSHGWNEILPGTDAHEYHRFAYNLSKGRAYSYEVPRHDRAAMFAPLLDENGALKPHFAALERFVVDKPDDALAPTAARSPGFPWFLAATYAVMGENGVAAMRVIQCLVAGLAACLVLLAAGRIRRGLFVAVALGGFVFNDLIYEFCAQILTDAWAVLWLGLAFVLAAANTKRRLWLDALAGAVLAFDLLVRPNHGLILPFYGLFILWETPGWTDKFKRGAVFGVAFALVLTPWVVRNYAQFDAFVPFSTQGGQTLATYNCDAAYARRGNWGGKISPEVQADLAKISNPIERQAYFVNHFKAWVTNNPGKMAEMVGWRTLTAWFSGLYSIADQEFRLRRLPLTLVLIFLPFGLWFGRRERWVRIAFLYLLAYQINSWLFTGQVRYLIHYQVVLVLLAARGVVGVLNPSAVTGWGNSVADKEGQP